MYGNKIIIHITKRRLLIGVGDIKNKESMFSYYESYRYEEQDCNETYERYFDYLVWQGMQDDHLKTESIEKSDYNYLNTPSAEEIKIFEKRGYF